MKAIIVTGDRNAEWYQWMPVVRDALRDTGATGGTGVLIHGDGRGIDWIAGKIGGMHGWSVVPMPAQWNAHGKLAGPMRNQRMADVAGRLRQVGYEVSVLAFHDDLDGSKGTKGMVRIARDESFPVTLYHSDGTKEER